MVWSYRIRYSNCVFFYEDQMCFLSTAEAHGLPCEFSGQVYQHGEDFQPSCQHQCTCMDGVVGCMPLCPQQMPLPDWRCLRPRLARPEGSCCEEWVCDDDNRISEEPDELTQASKQDSGSLSNHIGALLRAQLQPWTPAATRGVTFRGKTYPTSPKSVPKTAFFKMKDIVPLGVWI